MKISKQYYVWAILLLPFSALAQGNYWQRTYNEALINISVAIARDGSGLITVGYTDMIPNPQHGLMFKTDNRGNVLWRQTDTLLYTQIIATQDSGFLVVGQSFSQWKFYLRKLDKQYNIQWSKDLGSMSGANIGTVLQTTDLNYTFYGNKPDSLYIHKIDRAGNTLWIKTWRNREQNAQGMTELPDGGFLLHHNGSIVPNPDSPSTLIRTDAFGNVLWSKTMVNDGGTRSVAVQHGRITYQSQLSRLSPLPQLWQLDLAGNTLRSIPHSWQSPRITKRRAGGFWLSHSVWDSIPHCSLVQLDSNGAVVAQHRMTLPSCEVFHMEETTDSKLFVYGQLDRPQDRHFVIAMLDTFGKAVSNLIHGSVMSPCGTRFQNWLVGARRVSDGVTFYGNVNAANRYEIAADTGVFSVQAYPPSLVWESIPRAVTQTTFGQQDSISLIINCLANCPALNVDISTPILRRCFANHYVVNYCNDGTIPAIGAYVEVKLDSLLQYLNASLSLTSRVGQLLRFNLGTVQPNDCQTFTIGVKVACGDSTRLGQSLCSDVKIYPDTICANIPTWTGANIRVQGACERDSVHFMVTNSGRVTSSAVRRTTIENATLVSNTPINIGANTQLHYRFPANGSTWRMSVEQEPNHPYQNQPVAVVEGCRNNLITPISTHFATIAFGYALADESNVLHDACRRV
jgi:hypothetical protein